MPPKFSKDADKAERVGLLDDNESDEDFFLNGPSTASDKVRRVQKQVDEVVGVMQTNIGKVLERGERLDDLQDKSENLNDTAGTFSSSARRLQRKYWWQQMRFKICIGLVVFILIIIIIISVTLKHKKS